MGEDHYLKMLCYMACGTDSAILWTQKGYRNMFVWTLWVITFSHPVMVTVEAMRCGAGQSKQSDVGGQCIVPRLCWDKICSYWVVYYHKSAHLLLTAMLGRSRASCTREVWSGFDYSPTLPFVSASKVNLQAISCNLRAAPRISSWKRPTRWASSWKK